jgi:hypothetical protein
LATVIDSLLIELGLDSSKFDKAQKKSVEELRKFDEANQRTSNNIQRNSKETARGFEKSRDALISFGIAAFSTSAFTGFVKTMTAGNAELGRNSQLFGMSSRELDAWGNVLKNVGGTADDFQGSLQALQSGVAGIKLGDAQILTPLARLGALGSIDINKGTVDIFKLSDALKRFKEANGEQLTYSLAQQLGIDKNTFMILMQGSDAVHKLYNESYKLSGVNEKNTESAKRFQEKIASLSMSLGGLKNQIMDSLYPSLNTVINQTTEGVQKFTEWDKSVDGAGTKTVVFAGILGVLSRALALLGLTAATQGAIITGTFTKISTALAAIATSWRALTGIGLMTYSGKAGESQEVLDEQYRKATQTPGNYGIKTTETEAAKSRAASGQGSRSYRNSNPGNIKYGEWAKAHGAIGADKDNFAIFPTMEAGAAAQTELINKKRRQGLNTLRKLIYGTKDVKGWLGSGEDLKDAPDYLADLSKKTKIDPDAPIQRYQVESIRKAQEAHEGMIGPKIPEGMTGATATAPVAAGTTNNNVQTSINAVNIHTAATDPDGIAKDINKAIQNNSLINAGIVGNR